MLIPNQSRHDVIVGSAVGVVLELNITLALVGLPEPMQTHLVSKLEINLGVSTGSPLVEGKGCEC